MSTAVSADGVAEVVVDHPPVNALPGRRLVRARRGDPRPRRRPDARVVVLRAEGRGFNAGVDIKEMQRDEGFTALVGANRGCYAAFAAVYDCAVPVIAAVHGFCLGGGIGLVGNADIIIASDDATFGLPEVDRGALGRGHAPVAAGAAAQDARHGLHVGDGDRAELHAFGSVLQVVPKEQLRVAALEVAAQIARRTRRSSGRPRSRSTASTRWT